MKYQKEIKASIRELKIICHTINEFKQFYNNLVIYMQNNKNFYNLNHLDELSEGKTKFKSERVKKFYEENYKVLNVIKKYTSIAQFITNINYGKPTEESDIYKFYEYIYENKNQLEKILELIEKIEKLEFTTISLCENKSFVEKEYRIREGYEKIAYLENMEIIPNYEQDVTKYRTSSSNYLISIDSKTSLHPVEIRTNSQNITVNNLVFDPNKLPSSRETMLYELVNLITVHKTKKECDTVRTSVDLSINIDDLYYQLSTITSTIEKIENVKDRNEMKETLSNIKVQLDRLNQMSTKYDKSICSTSPSITQETLNEEKQLYIHRRNFAHIDNC